MSDSLLDLASLTDDALVRSVEALLAKKRSVDTDLLAHLGEIDARKLFAIRGYDSMFRYCVEALGLSEASARHRIHAARAARRFPVIFEMLRDGRLHVSGVNVLAPHLTPQNHRSLLNACAERPRSDIEGLVAEMFPRAAVPAYVERIPGPEAELPLEAGPADAAAAGPNAPRGAFAPARLPRGRVEPLRPELYKVQFTAGEALRQKLDELQALLRHQVPDGDLATVVEKAVDCLLEHQAVSLRQDRPAAAQGTTEERAEGRSERGPSEGRPEEAQEQTVAKEAVAPYPCGDPARGLRTRWRALHLRGGGWPALRVSGVPRVRPRRRMGGLPRAPAPEHPAPLPSPQSARRTPTLRRRAYAPVRTRPGARWAGRSLRQVGGRKPASPLWGRPVAIRCSRKRVSY